jgi:hypothetical protein
MTRKPNSKIVVFDTNRYSGNFERELCAFVTGRFGECYVGQEIARCVRTELRHRDWYERNVVNEIDDCDIARPAATWDAPDTAATESVAIFVEEFPPKGVLAEMVRRTKRYCKEHHIGYLGYRLLEPSLGTQVTTIVVGYNEVQRA